jgi:MHS family proline/betaine transporter-like MFS transporter
LPSCSPRASRIQVFQWINISVALFGGFAPFVATFLIDLSGQKVAPAYFVVLCATLTLATLIPLKESFRARLG